MKEMFFTDDEVDRCTATKNDILMCEGGAYYGRTAIWNYDYDICFQNHVHRLRAYAPISEKFFYYIFKLYRETGRMNAKGTAMPGLSSVVLHNIMVPLPPLAEQKRIVAKLEEILPLCDRLK
jgi:type I restriction enzyme S subunit